MAGTLTLGQFLYGVKNPDEKVKGIFEEIAKAEKTGNQAQKMMLKSQLFSVTPCVIVNKVRKYDDIQGFTGLLVLDFDHLDTEIVEDFKNHIFYEYEFLYATWTSPSRHGVKAIAKIPVSKSVDDFKAYYAGIEKIFEVYNGYDPTPKNCILPLFYSYDNNLLYRKEPEVFNKKHIPLIAPPVRQYIVDEKPDKVTRVISAKINLITDNGHPQLRAAAFLLGGYVGAGHISEDEATNLIEQLIDTNAYLSQKAAVYKRTAQEMIKSGSSFPVYINKY